MAQIFPKWFNKVPLLIIGGAGFTGVCLIAAIWYFGSQEYTEVGFQPIQPIPYSHKLHAGDLGMDCRYCHSQVEYSRHAQIPPTKTCMNCHIMIKPESEKLALLRDSWEKEEPIHWIRVHNLPDYAYFDHSPHLRAGVGCISCHGDVAQMEEVRQVKSLSMGWCLDCHRNPDPHLRPVSEITNMKWKPESPLAQVQWLNAHKDSLKINPPENCSGCHR